MPTIVFGLAGPMGQYVIFLKLWTFALITLKFANLYEDMFFNLSKKEKKALKCWSLAQCASNFLIGSATCFPFYWTAQQFLSHKLEFLLLLCIYIFSIISTRDCIKEIFQEQMSLILLITFSILLNSMVIFATKT